MSLLAVEGALHAPARPGLGADAIRRRIEADLRAQSILREPAGEVVRFARRTGLPWSYYRYAVASRGEFRVSEADGRITLAYRLDVQRVFWGLMLLCGAWGIALVWQQPMPAPVLLPPLAFSVMYGIPYAALMLRTRRFLRRLLAG